MASGRFSIASNDFMRDKMERWNAKLLELSDDELGSDDEYCPSWLKPQKNHELYRSQLQARRTANHILCGTLLQQAKRKPLIQDTQSKLEVRKLGRVCDNKELLNPFQKALVKFIETEIEYCHSLCVIIRTYAYLLEKERYSSLFSPQERQLLFQDIQTFAELSRNMILDLTERMKKSNPTWDSASDIRPVISWDLAEVATHFPHSNITEFVVHANAEKVQFEPFLHEFFKSLQFRDSAIAYFASHAFRMVVIKEGTDLCGTEGQNWLIDADLSLKKMGITKSLESLLVEPIKRLKQYPVLLNDLIDTASTSESEINTHELKLALMCLNYVIDSCKRVRPISSHQEMQSFRQQETGADINSKTNVEVTSNEEKETKDISSDVGSETMHLNKTKGTALFGEFSSLNPGEVNNHGSYVILVILFQEKLKRLKSIKNAMTHCSENLSIFMDLQQRYADMWKQFLHNNLVGIHSPNNYIESIYSCYVDKISNLTIATHKFIDNIESRIVVAISAVLPICEAFTKQIREHKKLRSAHLAYIRDCDQSSSKANILHPKYNKAQRSINIENILKQRLPHLILLLNSLVADIFLKLKNMFMDWSMQWTGERSHNEYVELLLSSTKETLAPHLDIITFYNNAIQITKEALQDNPRYASWFEK